MPVARQRGDQGPGAARIGSAYSHTITCGTAISLGGKMMRMASLVLAAFLATLRCLAHASDLPIEEIKLPPGFKIEVLARVDNAREMALGAKGTLFVGSMQAGKVYAVQLKPPGPPVVTVIASGLKMPVGVAFHRGALYVSAIDRILRLDNICL